MIPFFSERDESSMEGELKGKTLQSYLFILKKGDPVGVTELQRGLGFKNPSLASYHLDKLIRLQLVEKDASGRYYLTKKVKVGVLRHFVSIGRYMLPRYIFYAALFSAMITLYTYRYWDSLNVFALIFGIIASLIFWYEAIRVWKMGP